MRHTSTGSISSSTIVRHITFDLEAVSLFFSLIASRYERRHLIVTSNMNFTSWAEIFGDPVAFVDPPTGPSNFHPALTASSSGRTLPIQGGLYPERNERSRTRLAKLSDRREQEEIQTEKSQEPDSTREDEASSAGMAAYLRRMDEITKRSSFVKDFYNLSLNRFPITVVAETIGLQMRKILELIAKASLVAHRAVWDEASLGSGGTGTQVRLCAASKS